MAVPALRRRISTFIDFLAVLLYGVLCVCAWAV